MAVLGSAVAKQLPCGAALAGTLSGFDGRTQLYTLRWEDGSDEKLKLEALPPLLAAGKGVKASPAAKRPLTTPAASPPAAKRPKPGLAAPPPAAAPPAPVLPRSAEEELPPGFGPQLVTGAAAAALHAWGALRRKLAADAAVAHAAGAPAKGKATAEAAALKATPKRERLSQTARAGEVPGVASGAVFGYAEELALLGVHLTPGRVVAVAPLSAAQTRAWPHAASPPAEVAVSALIRVASLAAARVAATAGRIALPADGASGGLAAAAALGPAAPLRVVLRSPGSGAPGTGAYAFTYAGLWLVVATGSDGTPKYSAVPLAQQAPSAAGLADDALPPGFAPPQAPAMALPAAAPPAPLGTSADDAAALLDALALAQLCAAVGRQALRLPRGFDMSLAGIQAAARHPPMPPKGGPRGAALRPLLASLLALAPRLHAHAAVAAAVTEALPEALRGALQADVDEGAPMPPNLASVPAVLARPGGLAALSPAQGLALGCWLADSAVEGERLRAAIDGREAEAAAARSAAAAEAKQARGSASERTAAWRAAAADCKAALDAANAKALVPAATPAVLTVVRTAARLARAKRAALQAEEAAAAARDAAAAAAREARLAAALRRCTVRVEALGLDRLGRRYFFFSADPAVLYVQLPSAPRGASAWGTIALGTAAGDALWASLSQHVPQERALLAALRSASLVQCAPPPDAGGVEESAGEEEAEECTRTAARKLAAAKPPPGSRAPLSAAAQPDRGAMPAHDPAAAAAAAEEEESAVAWAARSLLLELPGLAAFDGETPDGGWVHWNSRVRSPKARASPKIMASLLLEAEQAFLAAAADGEEEEEEEEEAAEAAPPPRGCLWGSGAGERWRRHTAQARSGAAVLASAEVLRAAAGRVFKGRTKE